MESHPSDPEAEYSRVQVLNIANAVVPKQELLDAQMELVLAHLERDGPLDAKQISVTPLASGLSA
jgi:hypothetical protein